MYIMPDLADFLGAVSCYVGSTLMKGYGNPQENALIQFVSAVVGKNVEANVPQINEQLMKLKLPVPSGNVVVGLTRGAYSAYKGKNAKNVGIEVLRGTLDQWLGDKVLANLQHIETIPNSDIPGHDIKFIESTDYATVLAEAKKVNAKSFNIVKSTGKAWLKTTNDRGLIKPAPPGTGITLYIFK